MQENNSARTAACKQCDVHRQKGENKTPSAALVCKQCDVLLKEKAQMEEEFENLLTTRERMAIINRETRGGKKRKTKKRKTKRKTKKPKRKTKKPKRKTKKRKNKKRKTKKHKTKKHKTKRR
jgi:hypothetical protein